MFFLQSACVIKKLRPDVIHTHSADLGFLISFWARLAGIPCVLTCHTLNFPYSFTSRVKSFGELFCLRFGVYDAVTIFDERGQSFLERAGVKNVRHALVAGVEAQAFRQIKAGIRLSARHQFPKFIVVGRIDNLKGIDTVLEAAALLKDACGYFETWIIGDGPQKERYKRLAQKRQLGRRVRFFRAITSRDRLMRFFCAADICISASLLETFSFAVVEAWAAELALIATPVGIVAKDGLHRQNCLVVPARNPNALAEAMQQLIIDRDLRRTIAAAGRRLVEQRYTWEAVGAGLDYLELAAIRHDRKTR